MVIGDKKCCCEGLFLVELFQPKPRLKARPLPLRRFGFEALLLLNLRSDEGSVRSNQVSRDPVPGRLKRRDKSHADLFSKELVAETLNYVGEVTKHAYKCWMKLPAQTRQWLSIEELINDGLLNLMKYERAWRPLQGVDRLRSMGYSLVHYYEGSYIDPYCRTQKRFNVWTDEEGKRHEYGRTVSIEAEVARYASERPGVELERALCIDTEFVDPLASCIAVFDLCQVYHRASEQLQGELVRWFLNPDIRFRVKGDRFKSVKKEFRTLACEVQFNITEARHIMRSPVCLDLLSRKLLQIPYNLDAPTPDLRPELLVPIRVEK